MFHTPSFSNTQIQASSIFKDIGILIAMLVIIIAIIHCQGWKLTRTLGALMFLCYILFLVQAIVYEKITNVCFGMVASK